MNCFVIMPFSGEFDDVYAAIKTNVEAVMSPKGGACVRLDEARPAGRITDRLLREIEAAAFCIADVTGNRPNVMWELGYAMALAKPTILLTQNISDLPFDVKDLQTLEYDRNHIARTLGRPLQNMILDTLAMMSAGTPTKDSLKLRDELVGALLAEVKALKSMLADVVTVWGPTRDAAPSAVAPATSALAGVWRNPESRSHFYARVVKNELVVPYCYAGDDELTGVYFGWRKTGDYWFARFIWLRQPVSGFAFVKVESVDTMTGAWWHDHEVAATPSAPPPQAGVSARWERLPGEPFPAWATRFLDEVREEGLASRLTRR